MAKAKTKTKKVKETEEIKAVETPELEETVAEQVVVEEEKPMEERVEVVENTTDPVEEKIEEAKAEEAVKEADDAMRMWIPPGIARYVKTDELEGHILPGYKMTDTDGKQQEYGIYLPIDKDGYGSKKIFTGKYKDNVILRTKRGTKYQLVKMKNRKWSLAKMANGAAYSVSFNAVVRVRDEQVKAKEAGLTNDYEKTMKSFYVPANKVRTARDNGQFGFAVDYHMNHVTEGPITLSVFIPKEGDSKDSEVVQKAKAAGKDVKDRIKCVQFKTGKYKGAIRVSYEPDARVKAFRKVVDDKSATGVKNEEFVHLPVSSVDRYIKSLQPTKAKEETKENEKDGQNR